MTRYSALRPYKMTRCGAVFLGLVLSASACGGQPELNAGDLLARAEKTYSDAETYRDRGVSTTVLRRPGSPAVSTNLHFETVFQRSAGFRLSYWTAEPGSGRTVLAAGTASQSWVEGAEIPAGEGTLAGALRGAVGPSSSVSVIAASLLTAETTSAGTLLDLSQLERLPDTEHRGRPAHVVRGVWHRYTATVWLDAAHHLIVRVDLSGTGVGPQAQATVEQSIEFEPAVGTEISTQELQLSFRGADG